MCIHCGISLGNKEEETRAIIRKSTENTILNEIYSHKSHIISFSLHVMTKIDNAVKIASGSVYLTRDYC